MRRTITSMAAGGLLGVAMTPAAPSPSSALPPNPIEPWGQAVSAYARSLPPNPIRGPLVSAFARLHGEYPPIIIGDWL